MAFCYYLEVHVRARRRRPLILELKKPDPDFDFGEDGDDVPDVLAKEEADSRVIFRPGCKSSRCYQTQKFPMPDFIELTNNGANEA